MGICGEVGRYVIPMRGSRECCWKIALFFSVINCALNTGGGGVGCVCEVREGGFGYRRAFLSLGVSCTVIAWGSVPA